MAQLKETNLRTEWYGCIGVFYVLRAGTSQTECTISPCRCAIRVDSDDAAFPLSAPDFSQQRLL